MATTAAVSRSLASVLFLLAVSINGVWSKSFTVTNNCGFTVWPGVMPGAGSPALDSTGFQLSPGQSQTLSAPTGWSGKLWGRTLCSTDITGKFTCMTGDCGSGRQDCAGGNAAPPATLVEFTLDGSGGMDSYDVSLVDGYNLPVLVVPQGASPGGNCAPTGCLVDLNSACPADLRVTSAAAASGAVACKSACGAFGSPQYCCSGDQYGSPSTCKPSAYSQFFKHACPRAYSYAYDDASSTFTCASGDTTYTITFCPSTISVKSSSPNSLGPPGDQPVIKGTMTYTDIDQVAAATTAWSSSRLLLLSTIFIVLALAGVGMKTNWIGADITFSTSLSNFFSQRWSRANVTQIRLWMRIL